MWNWDSSLFNIVIYKKTVFNIILAFSSQQNVKKDSTIARTGRDEEGQMSNNWGDCLNTLCYMCLYYLPGSGHLCAIHVCCCYCRQLSSVSSLMYLDVFNLMSEQSLANLQDNLPEVDVNKFLFSSVARPTVGIRRTSIWGLRVRDWYASIYQHWSSLIYFKFSSLSN